MRTIRSVDLFCKVVDNYGDIGICWRLARELVRTYGLAVRLWVDDLPTFARLRPLVDPDLLQQKIDGIEIRKFVDPLPPCTPCDVVIEGFACGLPENFVHQMVQQNPAPVWINLEYLSAETWVFGCHGKPSPHPRLPLTTYFFFPGFDARTGGMLREESLFLPEPLPPRTELHVSLFAYENAAVAGLLSAWTRSERPIVCHVPEGRVLTSVAAWGVAPLKAGDVMTCGALTLSVEPFREPDAYDDLLRSCDFNFVRGEDSLCRALHAGRPLVWQAYPQSGDAHLLKLSAFIHTYTAGLDPAAVQAWDAFLQAWNTGGAAGALWPDFMRVLPDLQGHALAFARDLAGRADLAKNLMDFCRKIG